MAVAMTQVAAVYLSQASDETTIRVREVLDMPEFPLVHVAGVCDITADGATCWDNQGRPFKSLGERITAYYLTQNFASLAIRPGVKNRWVAFERTDPAPDAIFRYGGFEFGNTGGYVNGWRSGMTLEWARLDMLKEDTTAQVALNFNRELSPVKLAMKKGASADVGGLKLTVADFGRAAKQKLTERNTFRSEIFKYFVSIKRTELAGAEQSFTTPIPLDKTGKAIQWVSENGKPAASASVMTTGGMPLQFSISTVSAPEVRFSTNVDPSAIAELQFGQYERRKVIFENIRLDPISSTADR